MPQIILVSHHTSSKDLKVLLSPDDFILHLPTKFITSQEKEKFQQLISEVAAQPEQIIEINISSIIQKTWRIIKHYSPNQASPDKGEPNKQSKTTKLTEINKNRLQNIESQIKKILLSDQAIKLSATPIDLTS